MSNKSISETVSHLVAVLNHPEFPPGLLAALRRMNPGQPPPIAYWRFASAHLDSLDSMDRWMPIVAAMAWAVPFNFASRRRFGAALAQAGFSELRLHQLLAAQDAILIRAFLRATRFLASQDIDFDWASPAALLLTTNPQKLQHVKQDIAVSYYRHLS